MTEATWDECPPLLPAQTDCCRCEIYPHGTEAVTSICSLQIHQTTSMKTVIIPHWTWEQVWRRLDKLSCLLLWCLHALMHHYGPDWSPGGRQLRWHGERDLSLPVSERIRGCSVGPPRGSLGSPALFLYLSLHAIPNLHSWIYSVNSFEETHSQASVSHVRVLSLPRPRRVEAFMLKQWYDEPLLSQVEKNIFSIDGHHVRNSWHNSTWIYLSLIICYSVYILSEMSSHGDPQEGGRNVPLYLSFIKFIISLRTLTALHPKTPLIHKRAVDVKNVTLEFSVLECCSEHRAAASVKKSIRPTIGFQKPALLDLYHCWFACFMFCSIRCILNTLSNVLRRNKTQCKMLAAFSP